jgi:HK97 family phage prohead protease
MNENLERRVVTADATELRLEGAEGGPDHLVGSWSVFDSRSEDLGGFHEYIMPGAFNSVLQQDVRALFNHDSNQILGRTTNGTLKLWQDERAAYYDVQLDTDHVSQFVRAKVQRGDVTGNSFAFVVDPDQDEWRVEDGQRIRRIHRVTALYDVGPVTYPAYRATSVSARALASASEALGVNFEKEYWERMTRSYQVYHLGKAL